VVAQTVEQRDRGIVDVGLDLSAVDLELKRHARPRLQGATGGRIG
jgi:hypothetical protein